MTKEEAKNKLLEGYKLTHPSFLDTEYVYQHGVMIFTEEGYSIAADIFWADRKNMTKDWSIFKSPYITIPELKNLGFTEETLGTYAMVICDDMTQDVHILEVVVNEDIKYCSIDLYTHDYEHLVELKDGLCSKESLIHLIESFKLLYS